MHKWVLCGVMAMVGMGSSAQAFAKTAENAVKVTADEAQQRVDVTIDGKPFTSYVWPSTLKKPVLFPLIAADGVTVTRGYPLAPRDGERVDHPHHAGLWFNYGNVNGFDFWNNSDAIKPENREKMGTIHQEKIVSTKSGHDRGELVVDSVWVTGKNQKIINETTRYVFSQHGDERVIDFITTLHALDKVVFNDDKEGVLGIRVAHFLESATEKGGIFSDASGHPTEVAAGNTAGATGVYLTSEGKKGDAVWSTRGRWCELTGTTPDGKTETIAILDNPTNPGYPTYWHARGYGLFAANPLGRKIFVPSQTAFDFTIDKGQSATFRYRVILLSHAATAEEMNRAADRFAAEYK
ncbi:PmoA family protein [Edaphobacter paludis]|uniref:PmoA family protein n=1 Tax=Edaphobacter paludis TaxID=3035702 RepID=A0AAU7CUP4_9BACT